VIDCEIAGDQALHYNVAREKLIGDSAFTVRREIRDALLRGIAASPLRPRFAPETVKVLQGMAEGRDDAENERPVPPEVLRMVRQLVPPLPWPSGLHRDIAARLEISNRLVGRALTTIANEARDRKALN
jgi:hypothetical protein